VFAFRVELLLSRKFPLETILLRDDD